MWKELQKYINKKIIVAYELIFRLLSQFKGTCYALIKLNMLIHNV